MRVPILERSLLGIALLWAGVGIAAVVFMALAATVNCNANGACAGTTPQADLVLLNDPAGGGGVTVDGGSGNDRIIPGSGGADGDDLDGSAGNDFIDGGGDADNIGDTDGVAGCQDTDEPGNDRLFGGVGNDTICGGSGNDRIEAGAGDDVVSGNAGNDFINMGGAATSETGNGGDGNDTLVGGTCQTNVTLNGDAGNDTLNAVDGCDHILNGGAGNDRLLGASGNDRLAGGAGNDTLVGGLGDDDNGANMAGGLNDGIAETDTYILHVGDGPGAGGTENIDCTSGAEDTGRVILVGPFVLPPGVQPGRIGSFPLVIADPGLPGPIGGGNFQINNPGGGACFLILRHM
jgi:hypothetical protein